MPEGNRPRQDSVVSNFDPDNGWSDDIEEVLESIRHNAAIMSEKHKKLYIYFKGQLKYYKIPVIIISGLNSVIAVGLQPYLEQGLISGSNCLLALLCGIIGSIELFLGIQLSMETELVASKNFYLLAANIYKTVSLDRHRRPNSGDKYLEEVYTEYTKLFENSALIRTKMKDKLAELPQHNGKKGQSDGGSPFRSTPKTGRSEYEMTPPTRKYHDRSPRNYKMPAFTPMPSPNRQPSPLGMMDPTVMFSQGAQNMIDPKSIEALGYQNMVSSEQVMSTGNDLLAGRGMMEDMAGVQSAMNNAARMAALAGTGEDIVESLTEQVHEKVESVKEQVVDSLVEKSQQMAKQVVTEAANNAIENISSDIEQGIVDGSQTKEDEGKKKKKKGGKKA